MPGLKDADGPSRTVDDNGTGQLVDHAGGRAGEVDLRAIDDETERLGGCEVYRWRDPSRVVVCRRIQAKLYTQVFVGRVC